MCTAGGWRGSASDLRPDWIAERVGAQYLKTWAGGRGLVRVLAAYNTMGCIWNTASIAICYTVYIVVVLLISRSSTIIISSIIAQIYIYMACTIIQAGPSHVMAVKLDPVGDERVHDLGVITPSQFSCSSQTENRRITPAHQGGRRSVVYVASRGRLQIQWEVGLT